jgi:hypothetical protein
MYATASAIGLNTSFLVGNEVIVDDQEVSSANRSPVTPDDLLGSGGALSGDRIVIRYRNTTGAAITAFTRLDVAPVA